LYKNTRKKIIAASRHKKVESEILTKIMFDSSPWKISLSAAAFRWYIRCRVTKNPVVETMSGIEPPRGGRFFGDKSQNCCRARSRNLGGGVLIRHSIKN
jgi:hypothetical protein